MNELFNAFISFLAVHFGDPVAYIIGSNISLTIVGTIALLLSAVGLI